MTSIVNGNDVLSSLTLAFIEDTGWYWVNNKYE